jgi:hypothetical protein
MLFCGVGFSEAWQGVQGEKKKAPDEKAHRRPTRPWRTLAWLFLVGLRPRRARLRFTRRRYYRGKRAGEKPSDETQEDTCWRKTVAPAFLRRRRGPRGRMASLSVPVDSALAAERNSE